MRTDHKGVKNLETFFFVTEDCVRLNHSNISCDDLRDLIKTQKFEVREKDLKYNKNKRTRETKQEF